MFFHQQPKTKWQNQNVFFYIFLAVTCCENKTFYINIYFYTYKMEWQGNKHKQIKFKSTTVQFTCIFKTRHLNNGMYKDKWYV